MWNVWLHTVVNMEDAVFVVVVASEFMGDGDGSVVVCGSGVIMVVSGIETDDEDSLVWCCDVAFADFFLLVPRCRCRWFFWCFGCCLSCCLVVEEADVCIGDGDGDGDGYCDGRLVGSSIFSRHTGQLLTSEVVLVNSGDDDGGECC